MATRQRRGGWLTKRFFLQCEEADVGHSNRRLSCKAALALEKDHNDKVICKKELLKKLKRHPRKQLPNLWYQIGCQTKIGGAEKLSTWQKAFNLAFNLVSVWERS